MELIYFLKTVPVYDTNILCHREYKYLVISRTPLEKCGEERKVKEEEMNEGELEEGGGERKEIRDLYFKHKKKKDY